MVIPPASTHRTQEERRTATREALLDATVTALARYGYAGTTTTAISRLAGVSRGAQVHHFHTKADIVAAAIGHVARRRSEQLLREAGELPDDPADRVPVALDLLWSSHSGPLFHAALELSVAARTDPELRARLAVTEAELTRGLHLFCAGLFGADATDPGFRGALGVALASIRGTALLTHLTGADRTVDEHEWTVCRAHLQTLFPTNEPSPRSSAS